MKFTNPVKPSATDESSPPRFFSSSTSLIWHRAASSQQRASAMASDSLPCALVQLLSVAIDTSCSLSNVQSHMVIAVASLQAPVPGFSEAMPRISRTQFWNCATNTGFDHGQRKLPPLDCFRSLVGRFQLRIHPFVSQDIRGNPR